MSQRIHFGNGGEGEDLLVDWKARGKGKREAKGIPMFLTGTAQGNNSPCLAMGTTS